MKPDRAPSPSPGRTPRRALATVAALLAGAGLVLGSSASFTTKAAHPANKFSAGTLSISDSEDGAILTAQGMSPGEEAVGAVDISNTGSVAGTLTLTRPFLEDSDEANPLSARLRVLVRDCGSFADGPPDCRTVDPVVYDGSLAEMDAASSLGTFSPSEAHRYQFRVSLDASAGNAFQGASATATFRWDETS